MRGLKFSTVGREGKVSRVKYSRAHTHNSAEHTLCRVESPPGAGCPRAPKSPGPSARSYPSLPEPSQSQDLFLRMSFLFASRGSSSSRHFLKGDCPPPRWVGSGRVPHNEQRDESRRLAHQETGVTEGLDSLCARRLANGEGKRSGVKKRKKKVDEEGLRVGVCLCFLSPWMRYSLVVSYRRAQNRRRRQMCRREKSHFCSTL